MKYRIKELFYLNETSVYVIQSKFLWWWNDCIEIGIFTNFDEAKNELKRLRKKPVILYHD